MTIDGRVFSGPWTLEFTFLPRSNSLESDVTTFGTYAKACLSSQASEKAVYFSEISRENAILSSEGLKGTQTPGVCNVQGSLGACRCEGMLL